MSKTDQELDDLEARLRGDEMGARDTAELKESAADAIAELRKKNAGLEKALDKLITASTTVSDLGAQTGSQWVKLTTAILRARAVLQENTQ